MRHNGGVDLSLPPRGADVTADKVAWRAAIRAARRALRAEASLPEWDALGERLAVAGTRGLRRYAVRPPSSTAHPGDLGGRHVLGFEPLPTEPPVGHLMARLRCAGTTVWLPVTLPGGVLRWRDPAAPGAAPVRSRPLGATPAELAQALEAADLPPLDAAFVPALAVGRDGRRLGQGGGYYDRAVPALRCPVIAVVHDHERLDTVPAEPHDIRVQAVLTPTGVRDLPG